MNTRDERLAFALRFAQMPLPTRKGEWDKLRRDIAAFVGHGRPIVAWGAEQRGVVFNTSPPQELTTEEMRQLRAEVARLVSPRLDPRVARLFPGGTGQVWDKGASIVLEVAALPGVGTVPLFLFKGETVDLFLTCLLLLLIVTPADRICRCGAPSRWNPTAPCGKLFLRNRRQLYCSETCTNRANKQEQRRTTKAA